MLAIIQTLYSSTFTAMFQVTGYAGLRMYCGAGLLKAGLIKTKHRVPVIGPVMASQTLIIPGCTEPEISGAIPQTRKITGVGLNLLPQGTARRLMTVLTRKVVMATIHRATRMQTLLIRYQKYDQRKTTH
jgi:hypothetical protein